MVLKAVTQNTKDANLQFSAFRCQGWGHMARAVCYSSQDIKKGWGELRECGQTPHQQQSINLQHSLPDPKPKLTLMKAAKKRG